MTSKQDHKFADADKLLAQAKDAALGPVDLNKVWRRLDTRAKAPGHSWQWAVLVAMSAGLAVLMWPTVQPETPRVSAIERHRPQFSAQHFDAPPPTVPRVAIRPAPKPVVSPAEVTAVAINALPVPAPVPLVEPMVVVDVSPPPRPRLSAYQPRAIREFQRIDWQRWSARALPAAVAEMVRIKDSKGLLAALDNMPLRTRGSELLVLRGRLRAQAHRCMDARADLAAYSGDDSDENFDLCMD